MKLSQLKHPNVMEIVGVCLDGGAVPFLVMPFMSNGNLLQHLKTNRNKFNIISNTTPDELVTSVQCGYDQVMRNVCMLGSR